jgi:hypothetical protein
VNKRQVVSELEHETKSLKSKLGFVDVDATNKFHDLPTKELQEQANTLYE